MKLVKAMATVGGLTGVSRVFGFIRDILTAAVLGAGPIADAFFVALKLPNFFRRVTAEGAFSVAFVPMYSEKLAKEDRSAADAFASNTFMVMLLLLAGFTGLAMLGMPYVIHVIAPGFVGDAIRFDLAIELSRVTFPYLLLMSLTALLGGVLNALDRFAPFAFAPVLFNVCLIAALLLNETFESAGHALAYGVFFAGIVQLVWLFVAAKRASVHLRFKRPAFNSDIKRVFKLMGPGVIGAGAVHINLFANMIIASFLGTGAISYLYYADRLNQLPLGVVGIAVGTALLPMLSKTISKGDMEGGRGLFNRALEMCLLLALPAAAALMVIPHELISVLFERGAFDSQDTEVTAKVLQCYAIGAPAYIAGKVFATNFWARQDTMTPVKISIAGTIVSIVLCLIFIQFIGVVGIALATGLAGWVQFVIYMIVLRKDIAAKFDKRFQFALPRIVGATFLMVAVLYGLAQILPAGVFGLIVLVVAGLVVYAAGVFGSGVLKPSEIKAYFSRG